MRFIPSLLATIALLVWAGGVAAAPVTQTIDSDISIQIGYLNEPVIVGDTNAVRIKVTQADAPYAIDPATLFVQVEYEEALRVLELTPDPVQADAWLGYFIPVQAGEYTFTVFGTIGDVEVNATFTGADGLPMVEDRFEYEFPQVAFGWTQHRAALPLAVTLATGAMILILRGRSAGGIRRD